MISNNEMHILFQANEKVIITTEYGEVISARLSAPLYPNIGRPEGRYFSRIPVEIDGELRHFSGIIELSQD